MTEYQKMLGGQLYNAQDGELQAMHRTAMELCHALNQLNPNQKEEARALLQQLLGRTGDTSPSNPPSGATTAGTSPSARTSSATTTA